MKQQIRKKIQEAIGKLYPEAKVDFSVDFAPSGIDADFASNVALILAKRLRKKPMEAAENLAAVLSSPPREEGQGEVITLSQSPPHEGEKWSAAAPGFLNFTVPQEFWLKELEKILKEGSKYGRTQTYKGKKARVEFVSANPTGPIHIGNARGGPYGEVICKVLEAAGYEVFREYLHNDMGGQVEKLGRTIW
jgi:arginyl-tRNA synthetase